MQECPLLAGCGLVQRHTSGHQKEPQGLPCSHAALQPVATWTQWFTRLLLGSLYPCAPFERKFMAMLLLEALLTTWNTPDKANRQNFRCAQQRRAHTISSLARLERGS